MSRKTNSISLIFYNLKPLNSNGKATCYEICLITKEKAKFPFRKTSHSLAINKDTTQTTQLELNSEATNREDCLCPFLSWSYFYLRCFLIPTDLWSLDLPPGALIMAEGFAGSQGGVLALRVYMLTLLLAQSFLRATSATSTTGPAASQTPTWYQVLCLWVLGSVGGPELLTPWLLPNDRV